MTKVTFGFIVGGDDAYYDNLMRACESLERVKQPHEILIIDMDDRLDIDSDGPTNTVDFGSPILKYLLFFNSTSSGLIQLLFSSL